MRRDSSESIYTDLVSRAQAAGDPRLLVCFPVPVPPNFKERKFAICSKKQGYTRFFEPTGALANETVSVAAPAPVAAKKRGRRGASAAATKQKILAVVQDRLRAGTAERGRVLESLEAALRVGRGRVDVYVVDDSDPPQSLQVCVTRANCTVPNAIAPTNSRTRACSPSTRPWALARPAVGFGRTIGIDYGLVIPDESKTLRGGAIKPWQTKSYAECQEDLEKFAKKRGIPLDTPWRELGAERRKWVIEAKANGPRASGTACVASSPGSRPNPTRCTYACCSHAIGQYTPAPLATARD